VHPDKNPGDACASPAFQFLRQAYEEMKKRSSLGKKM
jgi:curved DNA-binding protein CbpA